MMEKQARELSLSDLYTYVIHSLISLLIPLVFAVMFAFEGYEAIFYSVYLIGPLGIVLMFYLHVVVFSIIFRLIIMVP